VKAVDVFERILLSISPANFINGYFKSHYLICLLDVYTHYLFGCSFYLRLLSLLTIAPTGLSYFRKAFV